MHINNDVLKKYSIKEVSILSGLPESTLRYYESIGLIDSVDRGTSSKQRVYSEDNLNYIMAISCLNSIGMSIEDIRAYFTNSVIGIGAAQDQIELLKKQEKRLVREMQLIKLRKQYVLLKIDYWNAVLLNNKKEINRIASLSKEMAIKIKNSK